MACCLVGTKPLPELMLVYCQLDYHLVIIFIQENEFENAVYEMVAILSWERWAKPAVIW